MSVNKTYNVPVGAGFSAVQIDDDGNMVVTVKTVADTSIGPNTLVTIFDGITVDDDISGSFDQAVDYHTDALTTDGYTLYSAT